MDPLGLPQGFEVFHDVKDVDDLDDMSLGSVGEFSLVTLDSTLERCEMDAEDKKDSKEEKEDAKKSAAAAAAGKKGEKDDKDEKAKAAAAEPQPEPRMVSADSMATVKHANVNQPMAKPPTLRTKQTPYDSLKNLVKSKKRQLTGRPQGFPDNSAAAGGGGGGGMISRPSTFLRQALYGSAPAVPRANQEFDQLSNKRTKLDEVEVTNPLLHKACMKAGAEAEVIEAILKIDKNLAGKPHQIYQTKQIYDCTENKFKAAKVKEKYCYPLNIAIRNHVKAAAVELLVRAAPHMAALSDGSMKECSLSILLKNNPQDAHLADLLLLGNPACAKTRDRHLNTPLHVACQYGASLSIVKHICIISPEALRSRNRFGYTPFEVAMRSGRSNHIAAYLYGKQRGIV